MIRQINKGVVQRICAGQVILDLSSAVKELVENSLDAGATSIEIALKDYGKECFQVIDNGSGISPDNFKVLALKYHTSKLLDFPDLQSLTTFGFRGEALSSLCALGNLTVETRTVNEVVATHLTYDHSGLLTSERKTARQIGTTVTVKNLFSNLPVRNKEFRRNIRKEYGKLISLLNAYALVAKGVRIVCSNTTGKNIRSVVLKTQGSGSVKDNIITLFGLSTFSLLEPVSAEISDGCVVEGFISKPGAESGRNIGDRQFFYVNGRPVDMPKISKLVNELYRGTNSKQYPIAIINFLVPARAYDVNVTPDKREVFISDEKSILLSLREALENIYSSNQAIYSVNNVESLEKDMLATSTCSSIEKSTNHPTQLFPDSDVIQEEADDELCVLDDSTNVPANGGIAEACHEEVTMYGDASVIEGFAFTVNNGLRKNFSGSLEQPISFASAETGKDTPALGVVHKAHSVNGCLVGHSSAVQMSLNKFVAVTKRKHDFVDTELSESPVLRNGPTIYRLRENSSPECKKDLGSLDNFYEVDNVNKVNKYGPQTAKIARVDNIFNEKGILFPCVDKKQIRSREGDAYTKQSGLIEEEKAQEIVLDSELTANSLRVSDDILDATLRLKSSDGSTDSPQVGFMLHFSFEGLMSRRKQMLSRFKHVNHLSGRMKLKDFSAASLEVKQVVNEEEKAKALAAATTELERLFKKEDFKRMKVVGQFNLGFIIGKLDQDLFIVDQHAADEKYNYEYLSQSTILNQQPLLRPLEIELSPEEEIVISMHMDTFRKNGFLLEENMYAPPGRRFKLKAIPFSKNITFGVSDIKELICILSDSQGECSVIGSYRSDSADSVCPPKVRTMFASRACRSSVMVGDSLERKQMQKILEHLSILKSPWNCPHGRPTMRHLVDLRVLHRRTDEDDEIITTTLRG